MKKLMTIISLLLLAGCASIPATYTAADRATYAAIAPEYRAYVGADAALTEPQRELRRMTLDSWERRIAAAEADNE